ncbi:MAG: glutamate--tRNA ligase, partial [Bacteroidales bacterium]|nr:glutamate--tRNA ligase [Bacteroidales bacterium]
QMRSDEEIAQMFEPQLKEHGIETQHDYVVKVCGMMKERINFPSELWEQTSYFFEAPTDYDPAAIKKRWKPGMTTHMAKVIEILNTVPFQYEDIHKALLDDYIVGNQLNMGQVMNSLRLAVVGKTVGPDMLTLVMTIGKDETIRRVQRAIVTIGEVSE